MDETRDLRVEAALPLGQRLLRAGFPAVTEAEVRRRLGCDEIRDLENKLIRLDVEAAAIRKAGPRSAVRIVESEDSFEGQGYWRWVPWVHWRLAFQWKVRVGIARVPLDHYLHEVIPASALAKIEAARAVGPVDLVVAFPVIEDRAMRDPVVLGRLRRVNPEGGREIHQEVLIAQWG